MASSYIKLDWDWRDDPKVVAFEAEHGKAALLDMVMLFIAFSELGGTLDSFDKGAVALACKVTGKREKGLRTLCGRLADFDIIDRDAWERLGRAGSKRSISDAEKRAKRREYALDASLAAKEAREGKRG